MAWNEVDQCWGRFSWHEIPDGLVLGYAALKATVTSAKPRGVPFGGWAESLENLPADDFAQFLSRFRKFVADVLRWTESVRDKNANG